MRTIWITRSLRSVVPCSIWETHLFRRSGQARPRSWLATLRQGFVQLARNLDDLCRLVRELTDGGVGLLSADG
jgi:hypothetical protein